MEFNDDNFYDFLWQAHQKEKNTTELQSLPQNFYTGMNTVIKKIDTEGLGNNPKTRENALKLLNEIIERRKQKILIYIAYKKQPPQSNIIEEADFYNSIVSVTKKNAFLSDGVATKKFKVIGDLPEIVLPSGSKVGPLSKDQIIELNNREDIEYVTSNNVCEAV
jgi:hypothetical protein